MAIRPMAEAVATLGLVELLRGRVDRADRLFRRAVAAQPDLAEAHANHAALLAHPQLRDCLLQFLRCRLGACSDAGRP